MVNTLKSRESCEYMEEERERNGKEAFKEGGMFQARRIECAMKDREVLNGWVNIESGGWSVEVETS